MEIKSYEKYEYCRETGCELPDSNFSDEDKKYYCEKCSYYDFHSYLQKHEQILEPGSELEKLLQKSESARSPQKESE